MRTFGPFVRAFGVGMSLGLAVAHHPVLAQTADWSCVQRLVPKLEAGQMWLMRFSA